jgi:hypothetical protein
MVAEAGLLLDVDGDNVFGLGVFQTGKDRVEGAGGSVKPLIPAEKARCRPSVAMLVLRFFPFRSRTTKSLME